MNEEEIVEQLKEAISEWYLSQENGKYSVELEEYDVKAIEGLLSLYNQEKEKNKKLEEVIDMMAEKLVRVPENDFMSETQRSVVRFINLHIEEKKEHIKKYYFNRAKGIKNE